MHVFLAAQLLKLSHVILALFAVKGEGRRGSLSPVTEQDDAGLLNMVLGTLDVHMPERLTYPSKQADWRWRESRK